MRTGSGMQARGGNSTAHRTAGLTFSEVMSGGFSLGADDPLHGAASAEHDLVMRATLTIPDIDAFVADPGHEGLLAGSISHPPLGMELAARSGRFMLFAPSGDPDLKRMVYRMTFEAGNRAYTLHGEKHVRRGPVLRAWSETTTLRCRLHAGADDGAPVCGAGILRISVPAFATQLLSFRANTAGSSRSMAAVMARFFGFFSRELLDSYLAPRRGSPGGRPGGMDQRQPR